jgi:hypothetical protein
MELYLLIIIVLLLPTFLSWVIGIVEKNNELDWDSEPPTVTDTKDYSYITDQYELETYRSMKRNYLLSHHWDSKRKERLSLDKYTCQCCGIKNVPLQVHHIQDYKLIPYEPVSSLVSLCNDCHQKQHDHYGYPQSVQDYMNWNAPLIKD